MKRGFYAILWLLILSLCLFLLNHLFMRDDAQHKYAAFLEETGDIDLFLLGTSHMIDAVYPPLLWRDHGITSYNLGNPAETLEATYWTLRLAAQQHKPQVALIDVGYIAKSQEANGIPALSHTFLDAMPLSRLKLRAIWSLFPKGKRAAFIFPLVEYHTRWEEIVTGTVAETSVNRPFMRGAEMQADRRAPGPFTRTSEMDASENAGKAALRRIIETCLSHGIEPALTAIPFPAAEGDQKLMNSAQLIADEYGIPFFNLFDVDGLVDFETDCFDEASHLNPDGAVKVTAYLGEQLKARYALPDHRGDAAYVHWDEALTQYEALYEEIWADKSLLN